MCSILAQKLILDSAGVNWNQLDAALYSDAAKRIQAITSFASNGTAGTQGLVERGNEDVTPETILDTIFGKLFYTLVFVGLIVSVALFVLYYVVDKILERVHQKSMSTAQAAGKKLPAPRKALVSACDVWLAIITRAPCLIFLIVSRIFDLAHRRCLLRAAFSFRFLLFPFCCFGFLVSPVLMACPR